MQEMQETEVLSLHPEYPLHEEMATHSSILAWEILWTEEPGRTQSMGSERVGHDLATKQHHHHILRLKTYMKTRMLPKKPED